MFWKKKKLTPENNSAQNESSEPVETKVSSIELANNFIDEFNSSLEKINNLAKSSITDWQDYLTEQNISSVTSDEREKAKASGLPLPKIAFPSEYRSALQLLQLDYKLSLEEVKEKVKDDFNADDIIDEFVRRKYGPLIEDELRRYLNSTKPSVSVSDIFANASTSMNKYSVKVEDQGDKSYSIKCNTCGAARLEEDQYDTCFYCGTPLFN